MGNLTNIINFIGYYLLSRATKFLGPLETSKLATGTKNLLADIQKILLMLAPIIGGVVLIYLFIRRAGADEHDKKMWDNRIKVTIISTVGAVLAVAILKIILSYYL